MGFRRLPSSESYNLVFVVSREENATLTGGEAKWAEGRPTQDRLDEQTHTALTSLSNRILTTAARQNQNAI